MEISAEMVAQVLTAAGAIAASNGRYQEAEKLYLDALTSVDEAYGPKSYQAASLYTWLSELSDKQGKTAESAIFLARVEEINRVYRKAHVEPPISDLLHSL